MSFSLPLDGDRSWYNHLIVALHIHHAMPARFAMAQSKARPSTAPGTFSGFFRAEFKPL